MPNPSIDNHPQLTLKEIKDLKILAWFTSVYCTAQHCSTSSIPLSTRPIEFAGLTLDKFPVCAECAEFLNYAFERRLRCPLPEKPSCKHCPIHCYRSGHREKVRKIMRFSGRRLLLRGRLDLLWHYLL
ncbi:MAG: nitrous oxide-stimulated promoter family protein [Desulfuromonas sp.]|nr:MAG: nitrous oxide-stimulated promoter family protein [Desulfuromonas sp.]